MVYEIVVLFEDTLQLPEVGHIRPIVFLFRLMLKVGARKTTTAAPVTCSSASLLLRTSSRNEAGAKWWTRRWSQLWLPTS